LHEGKIDLEKNVSIKFSILKDVQVVVNSKDVLENVVDGLAWAIKNPNAYHFFILQ
jgi:hypothetical protein